MPLAAPEYDLQSDPAAPAPHADGVWYAACDVSHSSWFGPNRSSYEDAQADARAHDATRHGGEETAGVLPGA